MAAAVAAVPAAAVLDLSRPNHLGEPLEQLDRYHIVLASSSPRRQQLLGTICPKFEVIVSGIDENLPPEWEPRALCQELAYRKAFAVAKSLPFSSGATPNLVIGADTVVAIGRQRYEKPSSTDEAIEMLSELSGKTHHVYTGVCVIAAQTFPDSSDPDSFQAYQDVAETKVTFRKLSPSEIERYVQTELPLDKAGSYGIQEGAAGFVSEIEGDINTVIGLPVALLGQLLWLATSR